VLPTAVFINHVDSKLDQITMGIEVSKSLASSCKDIKKQVEPKGIFHVNNVTGVGVSESFEAFMAMVVED
jgi:hypothetical protein